MSHRRCAEPDRDTGSDTGAARRRARAHSNDSSAAEAAAVSTRALSVAVWPLAPLHPLQQRSTTSHHSARPALSSSKNSSTKAFARKHQHWAAHRCAEAAENTQSILLALDWLRRKQQSQLHTRRKQTPSLDNRFRNVCNKTNGRAYFVKRMKRDTECIKSTVESQRKQQQPSQSPHGHPLESQAVR